MLIIFTSPCHDLPDGKRALLRNNHKATSRPLQADMPSRYHASFQPKYALWFREVHQSGA
jgi:hypothetical protein